MIVLNDQLKHHLDNWDEDSIGDFQEDRKCALEEAQTKDLGPENKFAASNVVYSLELLGYGVLLGLGCSHTSYASMRMVFALVVGFFSIMCLRELRSKKQAILLQAQREELAALLASIGAPPLMSNKIDHTKTKIELVASIEEFLVTTDYALERLQSRSNSAWVSGPHRCTAWSIEGRRWIPASTIWAKLCENAYCSSSIRLRCRRW